MNNKIQLKYLQYFEKLIDLKSYSLVAEFFNVRQSTISMGIKRLELVIGHPVIVHHYKYNRLLLTPYGEILHKYSKEIVIQLDKIESNCRRKTYE